MYATCRTNEKFEPYVPQNEECAPAPPYGRGYLALHTLLPCLASAATQPRKRGYLALHTRLSCLASAPAPSCERVYPAFRARLPHLSSAATQPESFTLFLTIHTFNHYGIR